MSSFRPLIFGEALFDCFPDGSQVLGGAPFNVAWHLKGLGLNPYFLGRIGNDDEGQKIKESMSEWGMDMSLMQSDQDHPTGKVKVSLDGEGKDPLFSILPEQAYDFIEEPDLEEDISMLYYGTLALRNPVSLETLFTLKKKNSVPCFVDVNLRMPWWDILVTRAAIEGADWVKMNDEELSNLCGLMNISGDTLDDCAEIFRERVGMELLIITVGEHGAFLVSADGITYGAPVDVPENEFVDAIGAGDAFSSIMISGLLQGWDLDETLNRALVFAAEICKQKGAIVKDKSFYQGFSNQWNK